MKRTPTTEDLKNAKKQKSVFANESDTESSEETLSSHFTNGREYLTSDDSQSAHWSDDLIIYEPCEIADIKVSLPLPIFRLEDLSSILNLETWNSLSIEEKEHLKQYLPKLPEKDLEILLQQLFGKENIFFGNPINQLQKSLQSGMCHESVTKYRKKLLETQKQLHVHDLRIHHREMLQNCMEHLLRFGGTVPNNIFSEKSAPKKAVEKMAVSSLLEDAPSAQPFTFDIPSHNNIESDTDSPSSSEDDSSSEEEYYYKRDKKVRRIKEEMQRRAVQLLSIQKQEALQKKNAVRSSKISTGGNVFLFFNMLKQFFGSQQDKAATQQQIEEFIQSKEDIMQQIPSSLTLSQFVASAFRFLSNPPANVNASSNIPGVSTPVVTLDKSSIPAQWRWKKISILEDQLQSLEQLFFFAITRGFADEPNQAVKMMLTKQQKCPLTIQATLPNLLEIFRQQEMERFTNSDKMYTYVLDGMKFVVAPIKRGATNPSNRAREHSLLKAERPPQINLLCLVRDAASRLPGGVGTRADVALLLKDSQFIVESATDSQLNSVVSGALDRLHSEVDPCVGYSSDQKLWVYLHKNRKAQDFEQYQVGKKRKQVN